MEKFTNALKCRNCRCMLETAIVIPCGHSVCKKHEEEREHIFCYKCDIEYEVPMPTGGFPENKDLNKVINSKIYEKLREIDFGPAIREIKECDKSEIRKCDEVKEILKNGMVNNNCEHEFILIDQLADGSLVTLTYCSCCYFWE